MLRVVGLIDTLDRRGAVDDLLAPIRDRLALLRPARPLTLGRILILPFEDVLVPAHEVWPELWPTIRHYFESVHTTGEANWRSDELLPMQRFGFTEECYFDYSLNPIRGQSGAVEGILNIVQETTYRVLNDRRTSLLRELASLSGSAQNEQDACARILQALATDPADIPFALLYHIDRDQQQARLAGFIVPLR